MAKSRRGLLRWLQEITSDDSYLHLIHWIENFVAKTLSLTLSIVILISVADLIYFLIKDIFSDPLGFYSASLIELFGAFLNILIALELLENITAYLKKHVIHLELVVVTALIAVSRKIIIFDFKEYSNWHLLSLGVAILCLAASYWLVRQTRYDDKSE